MAIAASPVRVYYQVVDDPSERAQGRFFRFQVFDETDAGRSAARAGRFVSTPCVLPRGEFDRRRDSIVREVRRAAGLDGKEKELRVEAWTKAAASLVQARKLLEAERLLKQAVALLPSHGGAKQALAQVERLMKDRSPSPDEYQLLVKMHAVSYDALVQGRRVSRTANALADYVFCPKGHARPGFQPSGRVARKTDILRDHAKLVEAVLRERNLLVARVHRGTTKAIAWTKVVPSGWQIEDYCLYRELREPRTLVVKDKIPFEA